MGVKRFYRAAWIDRASGAGALPRARPIAADPSAARTRRRAARTALGCRRAWRRPRRVQHASKPPGSSGKLPGCRSACIQPVLLAARDGVPQQRVGQVGRALASSSRQPGGNGCARPAAWTGSPLQPARDEHPRSRGVHGRDRDACRRRLPHPGGAGGRALDAVGEPGCDLGLDIPFPHIIQFLDDPASELVREPGDDGQVSRAIIRASSGPGAGLSAARRRHRGTAL